MAYVQPHRNERQRQIHNHTVCRSSPHTSHPSHLTPHTPHTPHLTHPPPHPPHTPPHPTHLTPHTHTYLHTSQTPHPTHPTHSKVKDESSTGSSTTSRVRTTLTLTVENIEFDTAACELRVKGRNIQENQYVKVSSMYSCNSRYFITQLLIPTI